MAFEEPQRPVEILLVEDNPGDVELTRAAFDEGKVANHFTVAGDGIEALAELERMHEANKLPDLILLDLNMPRMDGRETLEEIKKRAAFRRIPVVILTTSKAEEDLVRTYELHANCYIQKPVDLDRFLDVVRSIEHFWLSVVALPPAA